MLDQIEVTGRDAEFNGQRCLTEAVLPANSPYVTAEPRRALIAGTHNHHALTFYGAMQQHQLFFFTKFSVENIPETMMLDNLKK